VRAVVEEDYRRLLTDVSAPFRLPISANPDRGGARVLFEADRYKVEVTSEVTPKGESVGQLTQFRIELENTDREGSALVTNDDNGRYMNVTVPVGTYTDPFYHEQDSTRIVSQYSDGQYDGLKPGPVEVVASIDNSRYTSGGYTEARTTSTFDVSGAPVKENARFTDVRVGGLAPGSPVGSATAAFENPAFHGIDVSYTLRVTGQSEYATKTFSDTFGGTTTSTRGPETTQVDLGDFTLPDNALLRGETITVAVEPDAPYLAPASTTVQLPDPTEWVRPSCTPLPDQVVEGETIDAGMTLQNTGSVAVPVSYTISAGDDSASGSLTVPADSAEPATAAFETVEPGELPVEFDWSPDV
jgi:hypothetical protein